MITEADKLKTCGQLEKRIQRLEGLLEEERNRFREAQETLEAIRTGAVDGIVRSTPEGEQVFILKGSDQPYRNLIEEMKEGALLISESGIILYSNIGFAGLVDAPLDKVIGTHLSDWVSARNIEVLNKIIAGNNTNGKRVFDISFQNTKHQLIPTQVSLSKIALDSINASALIITDLSKHMEEEIKRYTANLEHEITERKKAEEELAYQAQLLSNIHEAVIATDVKTNILFWNKGAEVTFGWKAEEVIGKNIGDLLKTKVPGSTREAELAELMETGTWEGEAYYMRKDGKYIPTEARAITMRDSNGNIIGVVSALRDITERKKIEERISWLASFPELNPDPIVEVDFRGKVIYSNPAAKNLFPNLENLGINHPFIFHINTALPILRKHSDRIVNLEILACNHWYSQRIYLVPDSRVVRIFGANIDGRKKVEGALMKAREELEKYATEMETLARERAEKLKDSERLAAIGQVAGMVGHDIRNPLQAIVSELYYAKQSLTEPKDREDKETIESLDFIQEQVDYINKIVADLQDFAKPLKPEFTDVDLCDFVVDALKGFSIPDGIETSLTCEKKLPPLRLDRTFMTRILANLANNAIQAMPNGGKLTVNVSRADKAVIMVVEDTGVGIPDEVKSKMFTPMFTTKAKGQGFGLSVVKRLVEAQDGTIAFESTVGKGTKFIITLPLTR